MNKAFLNKMETNDVIMHNVYLDPFKATERKKASLYLMWITRSRLSLGWIKSNELFHLYSFDSLRLFLRSTYEIVVLAGIQKRAVNKTTDTKMIWKTISIDAPSRIPNNTNSSNYSRTVKPNTIASPFQN